MTYKALKLTLSFLGTMMVISSSSHCLEGELFFFHEEELVPIIPLESTPLFPELENLTSPKPFNDQEHVPLTIIKNESIIPSPSPQKVPTKTRNALNNKVLISQIYEQIISNISFYPTPQEWEDLTDLTMPLWDPEKKKTYAGFYSFIKEATKGIENKEILNDLNTLALTALNLYTNKRKNPYLPNKKRKNEITPPISIASTKPFNDQEQIHSKKPEPQKVTLRPPYRGSPTKIKNAKKNKEIISRIHKEITNTISLNSTEKDWQELVETTILVWDPKRTKTYKGFYGFIRKTIKGMENTKIGKDLNYLAAIAHNLYGQQIKDPHWPRKRHKIDKVIKN